MNSLKIIRLWVGGDFSFGENVFPYTRVAMLAGMHQILMCTLEKKSIGVVVLVFAMPLYRSSRCAAVNKICLQN